MLNWLAAKVQSPMRVLTTALVWVTPPGAGKNTMLEVLKHIFGPTHVPKLSPADFERFQSYLETGLLAFVDEIKTSERANFSEALKSYVGNPIVRGEMKFKNAQHGIVSHCSYIFASNSYHAIPIEPEDRRFGVIGDLTDRVDKAHRDMCVSMFNQGVLNLAAISEVRAFWAFLLAYQVDEDALSIPPDTRARRISQRANGGQFQGFAATLQAMGWSDFTEQFGAASGEEAGLDLLAAATLQNGAVSIDFAYKLFRWYARKKFTGTVCGENRFLTDLHGMGDLYFEIHEDAKGKVTHVTIKAT
jgi:hypothetical protein